MVVACTDSLVVPLPGAKEDDIRIDFTPSFTRLEFIPAIEKALTITLPPPSAPGLCSQKDMYIRLIMIYARPLVAVE